MKSKRIYFCETAWDHEVGSCNVEAFANIGACDHEGCGVIEARVSKVRRVRKPDESGERWIPIRRMKHEQLKSIRADIARLQAFYKRVKDEPSPFAPKRKRKAK
jgi:hypothetical protein